MWLGLIYGPIVAGFAVVSVWCYSKHDLNRGRHAQIVRELALKRGGATQPLAVSDVVAGGG
jgi:Na+/melibiose symporter-like transporter